jgi:hypothetical protein
MQKMRKNKAWALTVIVAVALGFAVGMAPSGEPSFTYQGELWDAGQPVQGPAQFRFALFDAREGGVQLGDVVDAGTLVVDRGRFMASLDFGSYFNGLPRWIEIAVRYPGQQTYTTLQPRQSVGVAPMAMFALAGNAGPIGPPGPSGRLGGVQAFAESGTFVVPTGVTRVQFELWGGGGAANAGGFDATAGGSGAYLRVICDVSAGELIRFTVPSAPAAYRASGGSTIVERMLSDGSSQHLATAGGGGGSAFLSDDNFVAGAGGTPLTQLVGVILPGNAGSRSGIQSGPQLPPVVGPAGIIDPLWGESRTLPYGSGCRGGTPGYAIVSW